MTDKWFLQDIDHQLQLRNRVVIIDTKGQCDFLLPLLEGGAYCIFRTKQYHLQLATEEKTNYDNKNILCTFGDS